MEARQDSDKLAWDWIDALWEEAVKHVQLSSICRKIESFVKRTFGQTATLLLPMVIGGFNVLYPIKIEGRSGNVLVRMPCLNQAVFPVEKTLAEAATVAYVDQRTHLRAPRVFHHGVDSDIGPFMIIEDLGSRRGMGQALEAPRENLNNPAVLQPDISKAKLNSLYVEMASFKRSEIDISARRNDLLAKQGRLSSFGFAEDSCHQTAQALFASDWEFVYAAPTQFILDPPWWLLLDVPEMWGAGIEDWRKTYETRLDPWISAMQEAEQEVSPESFLFSTYMRESWTTGRFWLNYAARKSWAFDTIYWKYLDENFFGEREDGTPGEKMWKTKVHLLSGKERAAMERLAQAKMAESKTRVLIEWEAESAKKHLSRFLFD
ncbi:hypothetical protein FGSG_02916 [Fusarium graminearum PH-1]|uniref:Chromosome 2, complete genome n=1 Tax=Gibberella zeae (strain ATCC MYA-4620 / CBS 123657 / FGSC 9075 / NRRL 31084 / PH-1) TaxID=229533 RepID=I1RGP3_GIBZE|nr:hypothetical protein FGSG_02916 [Fusarium graminearum PH-1]ESU10386.1 hypothetical protein FGSG_02916 [Fusarium graminearum PH-1]CEF77609.1 unnamed protein product [Fusarium graminearum]|eukprot:XP_011322885.1 hypothetical protein FGSG_02916 [Fusarium graminearum PH-1]